MYTEEDIATAITAGILTEETATAFRSHVAGLRSTPAVDEENFRLITGFNDIFVVIACLLLLASVAWIGQGVAPLLGGVAVSGAAWLLAEFFTRKRGMALPSIVLLLAFVGGIFVAGISLGGKASESIFITSAISAFAAWLHWRRFKVPITVACGVAAAIGGVVTGFFSALPELVRWMPMLLFVSGVVVFGLAMRWDGADPERQTRKSDVAFWLHLLASPLLVHPVFSSLGVSAGQANLNQAIVVVLLYGVIALVSLAIDRRALMVSALFYVLYTFSALLQQFGVVSLNFAVTAFVIGSGLLMLSAFWHSSRAFVLRYLPLVLQKHLVPIR